MAEIDFHPPMSELMQNLLKLQSLDFCELVGPNLDERIAALRAKIPAPVLGHYDRLVARGRKGSRRHPSPGLHRLPRAGAAGHGADTHARG